MKSTWNEDTENESLEVDLKAMKASAKKWSKIVKIIIPGKPG